MQGTQTRQPLKINRTIRWIPPIQPRFKVNFNGVVFTNLRAAGLGVVVRDHAGNAIGSMFERVSLPTSPVVVEALACRKDLLFLLEN